MNDEALDPAGRRRHKKNNVISHLNLTQTLWRYYVCVYVTCLVLIGLQSLNLVK
jgi:hypothetical protein